MTLTNNYLRRLLRESLAMHRQYGWGIIPIRHDNATKRPAVKWKKLQTQPPTEKQLMKWFANPKLNITGIAVLGGTASGGLVCRDFDSAQGYFDWAVQHAKLAHSLPTTKSRNGYHVTFRTSSEHLCFRKYNEHDLYGKGEYRGTCKQYWLLPPSRHPSGSIYRWKYPPREEIPYVEDPVAVGLLIPKRPSSKGVNRSRSDPPPSSSSSLLAHAGRVPPRNEPGMWFRFSILDAIVVGHRVLPNTRHAAQLALIRDLRRTAINWTISRLWTVFRYWYFHNTKCIAATRRTAWLEFVDAFERCPNEILERLDVTRYDDLMDMFRALQAEAPRGDRFFISEKDVGRFLGKSRAAGWRAIQRLRAAGKIELVEKGSNLTRRASYYRVRV